MPAVVRLRQGRLEQAALARGLTAPSDIAAHVGLDQSTVSRVLRQRFKPGETIIARILAAFPDHSFEDLFEVVDEADPRRCTCATSAD